MKSRSMPPVLPATALRRGRCCRAVGSTWSPSPAPRPSTTSWKCSAPALRGLVRETRLAAEDFLYPMFVVHGRGVREEIGAMPGQYHLSPDEAARLAVGAAEAGVPGVLLFGLPAHKDAQGSEAWDDR